MLDALEIDGQPAEYAWPYLPVLPADLSQYKPPSAVSGVLRHRGDQLLDLTEAESAIRNGWPVILGLALSAAFYSLTSSTVLNADGDVNVVATHAVLAVGLFSAVGELGFLIRNSWGPKWGEDGYGYVLRSYIEPRTLFLGVYRA